MGTLFGQLSTGAGVLWAREAGLGIYGPVKQGWSWQGSLGNPRDRQGLPQDAALVAAVGPRASLPV